jgi:hypothetical protein
MTSDLEDVKDGAGVETRLLVDGMEESGFMTLLREQRSAQIKLETLSNLVLQLHLRFENIGGSPGLGEDEAVLEVGVLGLDVPNDGVGFGLATLDFEGHTGWRLGLDLKRGTVEMVVLAKKVIGGLAEILVLTDRLEVAFKCGLL